MKKIFNTIMASITLLSMSACEFNLNIKPITSNSISNSETKTIVEYVKINEKIDERIYDVYSDETITLTATIKGNKDNLEVLWTSNSSKAIVNNGVISFNNIVEETIVTIIAMSKDDKSKFDSIIFNVIPRNNNNDGNDDNDEEIKIDDISSLTNDLDEITDENGNIDLSLVDEPIEISMWSIVGDPDKVVKEKLIKKFNEEYYGVIKLNCSYIGHFDYYYNMEYTKEFEPAQLPDFYMMHTEKIIEYTNKEFFYPIDSIMEYTKTDIDFNNLYYNIDRSTEYKGHRYGIPVDAHGFLTSFRQDIIKKNGLGFDNNTRFIPESRAEYQSLLEGLRAKADAGELWIRDINKGSDHTWKKANKDLFYPSYMQSADPDGLSALYANGGSLMNETQDEVRFDENDGFKAYLTDQVSRYNNKLMGDGVATNMFGSGNTVMFPEGPWYVSCQYDAMYNNSELRRVGKGVTEEDATDPVYSKPYIASHPIDWWTLPENMDSENAGKWYGNGLTYAIGRNVATLKKAAAVLEFVKWYTQGFNIDDEYNLVEWCASGHIPAWKNVYESDEYQNELTNNMTLRALGDPEDIISMEPLENETIVLTAFYGIFDGFISALRNSDSKNPVTHQDAIDIIEDNATVLEETLKFY